MKNTNRKSTWYAYTCTFLLCSLIFLQPSFGQYKDITSGKHVYRPVVKNGRVLYFIGSTKATPTNPCNALYLYEDATGSTTLITDESAHLFTGWPDMDNSGNVAYTKLVGSNHEVFLYDGHSHLQITNNPNIPGSPAIGKGDDEKRCGYVAIGQKQVVFRDTDGNVYAYMPAQNIVKKINSGSSQTANAGEGTLGIPAFAHYRLFEFDGQTLVWMHQVVVQDGVKSNMTIYMATSPFTSEVEKITTFSAWTASSSAFILGELAEPFFKACGREVVWEYRPPAQILGQTPSLPTTYNEAVIGYYDGANVSTIKTGSPLMFHSVRVHSGRVAWIENEKFEEKGKPDESRVMLYQNGTRTLARYFQPPAKAGAGTKKWDGIVDLVMDGSIIVWTVSEMKCTLMSEKLGFTVGFMDEYCAWEPTHRTGFFTGAGSIPVFYTNPNDVYGGNMELDRGLAVFYRLGTPITEKTTIAEAIAKGKSGSQNISSYRFYQPAALNDEIAALQHVGPDHTLLNPDESNREIADRFTITIGSGGCGSTGGKEYAINGMEFSIEAKSGVAAMVEDIAKLELWLDVNANGEQDAGDQMLGSTAFVSASESFSFDPINISEGETLQFFTLFEMGETYCPCNIYSSTLLAEDISFSGDVPGLAGNTTGKVVSPKAKFTMFTPENMFGGDMQASLKNEKLPEKLGIRVKNFPPICGKAEFTITNPPGVDGATLKGTNAEGAHVKVPFVQEDKDAVAEVEMTLGDREGQYNVEATIEFIEPTANCDPPKHIFIEKAGSLKLEVVDLNNDKFLQYTSTSTSEGRAAFEARTITDWDALTDGGSQRIAASADGVTSLLVRVKLLGFTEDPGGEVNISISGSNTGSLSSDFGNIVPLENGSSSVSTRWHVTGAGVYAFAVYTVPLNFESSEPDRSFTFEASYELPGAEGPPLTDELDMAIYRPPMLFVHGMWSSPSTWGPEYMTEDPRYEKYLVDYAALSAQSFSDNASVLKDAISNVVTGRNNRRIATTKVVIVGHSMGGLLTRQLVANTNGSLYYRKDNFGQGDIYKLMTMGTPHFGSPVAFLTKYLRDHSNPIINQAFADIVNTLGLDVTSGAIDALCPGSQQLQGLGITPLPTHTLVGWYKDTKGEPITALDAIWDFVWGFIQGLIPDLLIEGKVSVPTPMGLLIDALMQMASYTVDAGITDLYSADQTDFLVTSVSQAGGIAQYTKFENTMHSSVGTDLKPFIFYETSSPHIAEKVWQLMESNVDDVMKFAPKLPAPQVQDDMNSCQ